MLPTRKFGYKKRKLSGVKLGMRGSYNHVLTRSVAKASA